MQGIPFSLTNPIAVEEPELQGKKLREWVKRDELDRLVPIESLTKRENRQIQVLLDNGCEKDTEGLLNGQLKRFLI